MKKLKKFAALLLVGVPTLKQTLTAMPYGTASCCRAKEP